MSQPKLFLFIGYPGAGKTTIAKIIADKTGAKHIWADVERHKLFNDPDHSVQESHELYERLNAATDYLLNQNKSVVFDTNFNYFADREKLREIAKKHDALTVLIWVNTPREIAKKRSVETKESRNLYEMQMSSGQFESIAGKLEPPKENEKPIRINGTKTDKKEVLTKLKDYL
jgi:predicted kinase